MEYLKTKDDTYKRDKSKISEKLKSFVVFEVCQIEQAGPEYHAWVDDLQEWRR